MGRALDFLVLITAIFGVFVMQMTAGAMLDPLRNEIQEDYELTDQEAANMNSMFTVVVKWAPVGGLFGLILLLLVREYRRQKTAAVRRI
jgi:hypothetical protein